MVTPPNAFEREKKRQPPRSFSTKRKGLLLSSPPEEKKMIEQSIGKKGSRSETSEGREKKKVSFVKT